MNVIVSGDSVTKTIVFNENGCVRSKEYNICTVYRKNRREDDNGEDQKLSIESKVKVELQTDEMIRSHKPLKWRIYKAKSMKKKIKKAQGRPEQMK